MKCCYSRIGIARSPSAAISSKATVAIDGRAEPLTATSVRIQNLGGFTGMYSKNDDGDATMSFNGDNYTINGTANGFKVDKPDEPATRPLSRSVATC